MGIDQAPAELDIGELRDAIRHEYTEVACDPRKGFHFHTGRRLAGILAYHDEWLTGVPEASIESFAGAGNPFAVGPVQPDEHVVDVGCNAGIDTLIAAKMVGPRGRAIGVDMTVAMLEKARCAVVSGSFENVEIREGFLEMLPVEDDWADVVISNGVLNLTPDKNIALREMHRVLRPGGRLHRRHLGAERSTGERETKNRSLEGLNRRSSAGSRARRCSCSRWIQRVRDRLAR